VVLDVIFSYQIIREKKKPERKETLEPDWDIMRGSFRVTKKEPEEFIE
jgi:hypothetical protein